MAVMAPVPAPQAPRAPTCLLQTSAQAAEPLLSSLTRPPARSRSRLRPCAPVSRETGEHAFLDQIPLVLLAQACIILTDGSLP